MRTRKILIGAGVLVIVCAGVLATMFAARQRALERQRQELEAAERRYLDSPPRSDAAPVLQLPAMDARSERGGIVVTFSNDTSDRQVVIDPDKNHLILEFDSVPDEPVPGVQYPKVQVVPLDARTLAPGEAAEPLFIPVEGPWRSVEIRFVHQYRIGGLTVRTTSSETIPRD